jgi:hypothetical protein
MVEQRARIRVRHAPRTVLVGTWPSLAAPDLPFGAELPSRPDERTKTVDRSEAPAGRRSRTPAMELRYPYGDGLA